MQTALSFGFKATLLLTKHETFLSVHVVEKKKVFWCYNIFLAWLIFNLLSLLIFGLKKKNVFIVCFNKTCFGKEI